MHPKLSNSPLIYVLLQARFSPVLKIESYIDDFQDKIRSFLPGYRSITQQTVQFNHQSVKVAPNAVKQLWHFSAKDKKTGCIVDDQSLTIHMSFYAGFESLLNKFKQLINYFNEVVKPARVTQLGLRYINLIEDGVIDMAKPLQGFNLNGDVFKQEQKLVKTETVQASEVGAMKIKTMRCLGSGQRVANLVDILRFLGLVDTPQLLEFAKDYELKDDFILLDIDHIDNKEADFVIEAIVERLQCLHHPLYQGFCQAVGEKNLANWR